MADVVCPTFAGTPGLLLDHPTPGRDYRTAAVASKTQYGQGDEQDSLFEGSGFAVSAGWFVACDGNRAVGLKRDDNNHDSETKLTELGF